MGELKIRSRLAIDAATAWRHATSPAGVNAELGPLLRMTFPRDTRELTAGWRVGERLFRSWILLFGLLPVEYDDVSFVEVEPGVRFLERSVLLSQQVWEHERWIESVEGGVVLGDRVRFEPRLPILDPLHGMVFRTVFAWRHRRLRRLFDGRAA